MEEGFAVQETSWQRFQRSKTYDLLAAVPLIAWYALGAWRQWPTLSLRIAQCAAGKAGLLEILQLLAVAGSMIFSILLIYLLAMRQPPTRKAKGILPRIAAILGTFLTVGIIQLKAQTLPLGLQALADLFLFGSATLAVIVLVKLGDAFSIMPEARRLVTTGPYAMVRHPLYVVEEIGVIGLAIQFAQPWASLLAFASIGLQVLRSEYEERVLMEEFPDYAAYRAKTWRFVPYVI